MTQIARHRLLSLLLATALFATLTTLLTQGQRANAIDGPVDVVYIATGRNFPDALAGGTLATTVGAPLLTVEATLPLPPATVAALEALDADRIVVFGGPVAVSADVVEALAAYARSGDVTRIAGDDRHDTAAKIADALPDSAPVDADTLGGLDSGEFVTADRLAELRSFSIPVQAAVPSSPGLTAAFSSVGETRVVFNIPIPLAHAVDDPLLVDLLLSSSGDCSIVVDTLGVAGPFVESGNQLNTGWKIRDGDGSFTSTLPFGPVPDGAAEAFTQMTFESLSADELIPGAVIQFGMERQGDEPEDTCGQILLHGGISVTY